MNKLFEFIGSFKNLHLKEIVFRESNLMLFLIGTLILILLLRWMTNLKNKRRANIGVSSLAFFKKKRLWFRRLPEMLFILGIVFLIIALLNPVLPLVKNKKNIIAKEIMIIIDCSLTMDGSKVEMAVNNAIKLIESRRDDIIGLIIYSDNSYLLNPFTNDYSLLTANLKLLINMGVRTILPNEGSTATGEALFSANEYLKKYGQNKERIIILFTDGESNIGRNPYDAFEEIKKSGFRVFILGISYWGSDESTRLAQNARETNGGFFPTDTGEDLKQAITTIDRSVGKNRMTIDEYTIDEPKYFYFVFSSLILFVLSFLLKHLHYFRDLL